MECGAFFAPSRCVRPRFLRARRLFCGNPPAPSPNVRSLSRASRRIGRLQPHFLPASYAFSHFEADILHFAAKLSLLQQLTRPKAQNLTFISKTRPLNHRNVYELLLHKTPITAPFQCQNHPLNAKIEAYTHFFGTFGLQSHDDVVTLQHKRLLTPLLRCTGAMPPSEIPIIPENYGDFLSITRLSHRAHQCPHSARAHGFDRLELPADRYSRTPRSRPHTIPPLVCQGQLRSSHATVSLCQHELLLLPRKETC